VDRPCRWCAPEQIVNLAPTFLRLAGVAAPLETDGRMVEPLLRVR
jgi:hypothetical protein